MLAEFSIQIASQLVNSSDDFPVEFDLGWKWLGYSDKRTAKQFLLKNFKLDIDYTVLQPPLGTLAVPNPEQVIRLTVDTFKMWAMMAGTAQGKQVRLYFIECEKQFKLQQRLPSNTIYLKDTLTTKELVDLGTSALQTAFAGTNIKPEVIGTLTLNLIESLVPELKLHLLEARQLLITNTATKHKLVTATEIGKALGISARAVNKILLAIGYQVANPNKRSKKDCSYLAVGQGVELSDFTLSTGQGTDTTTYQQLRWYVSIIEIIQAAIAS